MCVESADSFLFCLILVWSLIIGQGAEIWPSPTRLQLVAVGDYDTQE